MQRMDGRGGVSLGDNKKRLRVSSEGHKERLTA